MSPSTNRCLCIQHQTDKCFGTKRHNSGAALRRGKGPYPSPPMMTLEFPHSDLVAEEFTADEIRALARVRVSET